MIINKYPDGSSYAVVQNKENGFITFRINSYEDLWYLNQYVDANNNCKIIPNILITNLIDAQADRRFNENESFGLKLVCKFLNGMNANFKIFHPHNAEVVEALIYNVEIISNKEFIANVILNIYPNSITAEKNCTLMSSDAGGFKPLMKLCDSLKWQGEVASASKAREYKDGKTILTQLIAHSDFKGKDILIIDDICIYGSTFKGLSKMLKERNCGKLYLAVSHLTIQNLSEDPVTNYFDKVFTTNSKYDKYYVGPKTGYTDAPNNLEIIKMF